MFSKFWLFLNIMSPTQHLQKSTPSVAWNHTSKCVMFWKITWNMLRICVTFFHFSTMFVLYCYYINVIYTFNTFESLHTTKTNRRWDWIQYKFFIKCVIAFLICRMIQLYWFIWIKYIINPSIIGRITWFKIHKGKLQFKQSM